jgi:hypothetical protein
MARTPSDYAQLVDEPTIIVDPSLFLPPPRSALRVLSDVLFGVARGLVVASLAGATVFSVAHVLKHQTLTHGLHAQTMEPVVVRVQAARAASEESEVAVPSMLSSATALGSIAHTDISPLSQPLAAPPGLLEERLDRNAPSAKLGEPTITSSARADLMELVKDGRRLLRSRHLDEAESAFRLVLDQRSNQPAALAGLAKVSMARGKVDEARNYAERSVASAPYQASYHYVLADVLRASGDTTASQTEYELAARLSPNHRADDVLPPNPF